jgi:selenocysteine-specific elongation factor
VLRDYARLTVPKDASRIFRLPVDRAFTMRGFGTVVSGTLVAGRIQKDAEIEILPAKRPARVRGIQVHGRQVDEAVAGQRTALNLQRVDLEDVRRGMVIVPPATFEPAALFDVLVELLPTAPPILRRKRVRFHVGTAELIGYLTLLGQETLEPGGTAIAQLRLEAATFALPGDRFIIRQYSPMTTLGGGEILDGQPRRHRRSDAAVRARLERLRLAPAPERLAMLVEEMGAAGATVAQLVARSGLAPDVVSRTLRSLGDEGRLRIIDESPLAVVAPDVFDGAAVRIREEVKRYHELEPLAQGIGREDLKGRALREGSPVLFRAALDHLSTTRQIAVDQDIVRLYDRTVTLGGEDARVRALLDDRFQALGLQAPAPNDLFASLGVAPGTARKLLQLMVREGAVVKVSEDLFVSRASLDRLIRDIRALKAQRATFGVREFKELTGLSRRFAVPLLEYLDSQRVTRRMGDERIIL